MEPGLTQQQLTIRLRVRHSNGKWGEQTVTRTQKQKPGQHYYLTDHLGSVRATVIAAGTLVGWDDFYPYGMVMPGRSSNTANPNDLYKFTGHERDPEAGLDIDFMNARTYDSEIGRFLQRDPHAANYPGISPYVYVANNPLIFIDPDGKDIWVILIEDGKYRIVGGTLNDDKGIYVQHEEEGPIQLLGYSITTHSFFGDDGNAVEGAVIDMSSTGGQDFLNKLIEENPGLLEYAFIAGNDKHYDFKVDGETSNMTREQQEQHRYRGSVASDGSIGSARDFGNIGAGIVAGRNSLTWTESRLGFDAYQMYKDITGGRFPSREGPTTQKAQQVGYKIGQKLAPTKPVVPMRKP